MAARQLYLRVPVTDETTDFQAQWSSDGGATWTPLSRDSASPAAPELIGVAELDADGNWLLDGLNNPAGNLEAASETGNLYRVRLLEDGVKGNWSDEFSINGYPGAGDLSDFLAATGLTISSALSARLGPAILAARKEFEKVTGVRVLADSVASARRFGLPSARDGWVELDPAVSISSVVYSPASGDPTTYTRNTDYWLEPENAPLLAVPRPYTSLRLGGSYGWWGGGYGYGEAPRALLVTARWGMFDSVPDNIREALLGRAAASLLPQLRMSAGSGRPVKRWTNVDGISKEYDTGAWDVLGAGWDSAWKSAITRYRRLSI